MLPLVYDELRLLAAQKLSHEQPGQTLQATALVHEAYLRLVGDPSQEWEGQGHFFAAAAEAMRRILVENARRKGRLKRGGGHRRLELEAEVLTVDAPPDDILALDDALFKLSEEDEGVFELVNLRYFADSPCNRQQRSWGYLVGLPIGTGPTPALGSIRK